MAVCAALGLLLAAWVATAGPVPVLGPPHDVLDLPTVTRSTTASPPPVPSGATTAPSSQTAPMDLSWLGVVARILLVGLAVLAVLAMVRWASRRTWRRGPVRRQEPFEPLPDALPETVMQDADAQLAALATGSPRNAIVACWLHLEETAAAAGLPRDPSETAAELTTRVLATYAVDRRVILALAALYREARFSRHELTEAHRSSAVGALRWLHEELGGVVEEHPARPGR